MRKFTIKLIKPLSCIMILIFLLFLSTLIPAALTNRNLKDSYEIACTENNQINVMGAVYKKDFNADAVEINIMMHDSEKKLDGVLKAPHYGCETQQYLSQLASYLNGDSTQRHEYIQYWHGYRILWKPLLVFFNITGIRIFYFIIMIFILCYTIHLMIKKKDMYLAAIYAIGNIVFLLNAAISLEYIPIALITQIGALIVYKKDNIDWTLLSILGICTAFFDFLTAETLTFTIPCFMLLYKNQITIKKILKYGITWFISYVGTFGIKYLLLSIVYKRNYFSLSRQIYSEHLGNFSIENKFSAITTNINTAFNINGFHSNTITIIAFLIVIILLYLIRNPSLNYNTIFSGIILFVLPYARYMVLLKHSITLCTFTFRAQMISFLIILYFFKDNILVSKAKNRRNYNGKATI